MKIKEKIQKFRAEHEDLDLYLQIGAITAASCVVAYAIGRTSAAYECELTDAKLFKSTEGDTGYLVIQRRKDTKTYDFNFTE